ncbi:PREDICTED: uncharacterized protein LOC108781973 isoform X2 [Cyphomyrmex costatus]|nr:PREDICTED: uncharacterized protein LOC108781973 isoform X2 [Cyphomyrmex costatus]
MPLPDSCITLDQPIKAYEDLVQNMQSIEVAAPSKAKAPRQVSSDNQRTQSFWWNDICQDAVSARELITRRALKKLLTSCLAYKKQRRVTTNNRILRRKKRLGLKKFCSSSDHSKKADELARQEDFMELEVPCSDLLSEAQSTTVTQCKTYLDEE